MLCIASHRFVITKTNRGGSLPTPSSKSGLALAARFQSFRISVPLNGVVEWVGFDRRVLGRFISGSTWLGSNPQHSKEVKKKKPEISYVLVRFQVQEINRKLLPLHLQYERAHTVQSMEHRQERRPAVKFFLPPRVPRIVAVFRKD